MSKIISLIAAGAMALGIAGCNQASTDKTIQTVRDVTTKVCQFVPTVETVAAILTANATLPANLIANAICQAVTGNTYGAHPGMESEFKMGGSPVVKVGQVTIPVKGKFVE